MQTSLLSIQIDKYEKMPSMWLELPRHIKLYFMNKLAKNKSNQIWNRLYSENKNKIIWSHYFNACLSLYC